MVKTTIKRKAFTIIEVVMVVVVIGIISSTATIGFKAFTSRTSDADAKSNIARVLQAQQTYANSFPKVANTPGDYSNYAETPELLKSKGNIGQDITLTTGTSTKTSVVSMNVSENGVLRLAVKSSSGLCHMYAAADPAAGFTSTNGPGTVDAGGKAVTSQNGSICTASSVIL